MDRLNDFANATGLDGLWFSHEGSPPVWMTYNGKKAGADPEIHPNTVILDIIIPGNERS